MLIVVGHGKESGTTQTTRTSRLVVRDRSAHKDLRRQAVVNSWCAMCAVEVPVLVSGVCLWNVCPLTMRRGRNSAS